MKRASLFLIAFVAIMFMGAGGGCAITQAISEGWSGFWSDPEAVAEGIEKTASLLSLVLGPPGAIGGLAITTALGIWRNKKNKGTLVSVVEGVQKAKNQMTPDQKALLRNEFLKRMSPETTAKVRKIKSKLKI